MKLYVGCLYFMVSIAMLTGCGLKTQSGDFPSKNEGMKEISFDEAPYAVLIYLPQGKGVCTGTIVGPKAVLFAAHCAKGNNGRYEIRSKKGRFSTYTVYYRNYAGSGTVDDIGDLAMLEFDMTIADPEQIVSIGNRVEAGDTVKMEGFGCEYIDTREGSGVLRSLTTSLYSTDEDGFLAVRELYSLAVRGVTAGGTCFGDSGGPLLTKNQGKWKLVGATHAGGPVEDGGTEYEMSYFASLLNGDNRNYLHQLNDDHQLGMVIE